MLKFDIKDSAAALFITAILVIAVAIIGTNPLNSSTAIDIWGRATLGALGVIILIILLLLPHGHSKPRDLGSTDAEYNKRLRAEEEKLANITPENMIVGGREVGKTKIDVINGNILDSGADVIVSSDDNHFGARGGVAKAILKKAGLPVEEELARYRRKQFRQGQLAITTGGDWKCRAIIHPAVIDLDENRYPTTDVIQSLVRRSLVCAQALGARSVSFPVLGGGTASKNLKPSESASIITREILTFLTEPTNNDETFTYISVYVYDKQDVPDRPEELFDPSLRMQH